jgi:Protein kinase domain
MEKLQQWQRVKEIVGSALERPPAERSAYLDQVCSQNTALRSECESLLSAYRDSDTLSKPWAITALPPELIAAARFVPGIVAPVGQGGMGEVYRAEDLRLGQTVALKFLPKTIAHIPDAWAQLVREVRIARQISHPNICRVFDVGESDEGRLSLWSSSMVKTWLRC